MLISALFFVVASLQTRDVLADSQFDRRISFTHRAEPISVALAALSSASGISMQADGTVQPEFVLLRLNDVPLREVLHRLAKACGGEWTHSKAGYYLGRSATFEANLAKREYAYDLQRFTKVLAEIRRASEAQKPLNDAEAQSLAGRVMQLEADGDQPGQSRLQIKSLRTLDEIRQGLPIGRFVNQLIVKLSPDTLASVPPGERRVFSTSPTAMELPLTVDLQALADQFTKEQAIWTDVAARVIQPPASGRYRYYSMLSGNIDARGKSPQIGRVVMVVERQPNSSAIFVTAHLLNATGDDLARGTKSINLVEVPTATSPPTSSLASPALTLTKQEMQLAISAQVGDRSALRQIPNFDPAVVDAAQHPDTKEPLASFASSLILQAAEAQELNVVADVPDTFLPLLASSVGTRPETVANVVQRLHGKGLFIEDPTHIDEHFLEIDGGTILGPRRFRAARRPLASVLSSNPGGDPPLEITLDYILSGGLRSYDSAFRSLRFAASTQTPPRTNQFVEFGQVLAMVRAGAGGLPLQNFEIPFSKLDAETQRAITTLVFYQAPNLQFRVGGAGGVGPRLPEGIAADPCELFPNGLPPGGTVQLSLSSDVAVQEAPTPVGDFLLLDQPILGPLEFGRHMRRQGSFPNDTGAGSSTYRPFTCQIAHFTINLPPAAQVNFDFQAVSPVSQKYVPFKELPPAVKDALTKDRTGK